MCISDFFHHKSERRHVIEDKYHKISKLTSEKKMFLPALKNYN